jgi:uncharacterized protein
MTTTLDTHLTPVPCPVSAPATAAADWLELARAACRRVPPLWPLHSFVAVNPFLGLAGKPFAEVCELMNGIQHGSMVMSCDYFREQLARGRITRSDLADAIAQHGATTTPAPLVAWLANPVLSEVSRVLTVADAVSAPGRDWNALVTEEISKWCAAYFDDTQSAWRMPWKKLPLYAAWRQAAAVDATPELLGLAGFRAYVAALPDNAADAVAPLMERLQVRPAGAMDYLHRVLISLPGWSGYAQQRAWEGARHGRTDEPVLELLAVRLAFEAALLKQFDSPRLREFWTGGDNEALSALSEMTRHLLLWHTALELGYQRELCAKLLGAARTNATAPARSARPKLQAAFCIDVRSEALRSSLENLSSEIQTIGFAGFFGMPIEYVPFGQRHGNAQLPVLFAPKYRVREQLTGAAAGGEKQAWQRKQLGRRLAHSWNAFKTSAVSCFSFVQTAGLGYAWKLAQDGWQFGARSGAGGCSDCAAPQLHPHRHDASVHEHAPADTGIPPEDQVQLAYGALKNMGLTANFAPLVLLCGHASNTTNNPYAASLHCGACGGHTGDANARVAAALLNQPAVRVGLAARGIHIPEDTLFVAGLHDTTTDQVTLLDLDHAPTTHFPALAEVRGWLYEAETKTRVHRAAALGCGHADEPELERQALARSRDWSQTRPEWGLAGNAAFIAAPRARTRGLNLHGRVFLHDYTHAADTDKATLELILTAPVIVANWINLQYYASTVNNRLWGSGNKVIHNVVGAFGVQQGNGGDLQTGLPLQSLHDGERWVHEPLRLSVFIEAPRADIEAVLARQANVRELVENQWLHLFALEDHGASIQRRQPGGGWEAM